MVDSLIIISSARTIAYINSLIPSCLFISRHVYPTFFFCIPPKRLDVDGDYFPLINAPLIFFYLLLSPIYFHLPSSFFLFFMCVFTYVVFFQSTISFLLYFLQTEKEGMWEHDRVIIRALSSSSKLHPFDRCSSLFLSFPFHFSLYLLFFTFLSLKEN